MKELTDHLTIPLTWTTDDGGYWWAYLGEGVTLDVLRLGDLPAGADVPRPARVFLYIHRPAQRMEELQELSLHPSLETL